MRTLIVEDDFVSRRILKDILSPYGDCEVVVNGNEAVQAFQLACEEKVFYDLICLDIMLPETDGVEALCRIREIEKAFGKTGSKETKVIMVTALDDPRTVFKAFQKGGATAYIVKPIEKEVLLMKIRALGLVR